MLLPPSLSALWHCKSAVSPIPSMALAPISISFHNMLSVLLHSLALAQTLSPSMHTDTFLVCFAHMLILVCSLFSMVTWKSSCCRGSKSERSRSLTAEQSARLCACTHTHKAARINMIKRLHVYHYKIYFSWHRSNEIGRPMKILADILLKLEIKPHWVKENRIRWNLCLKACWITLPFSSPLFFSS